MLILASNLINLPVAALDSQSKVGKIAGFIINPDNGELIGFTVLTEGFFKKRKVLSSTDVADVDKSALVIKSSESILEINEIVRAKKIIEQKITVLGQTALTESKKRLGRVYDLLIDSETLSITKYYLRNFFDERILPIDKVVKITPKAVIFSDDVIEATPLAEPEGAAA